MPRPTSKKELIELGQANYMKLKNLVGSFTNEEKMRDFPEGMLNRNIRDVLAHLHHWHLMVFSWYEVGMRGEAPDIPAKGYNWRTLPDLNREIQERYCSYELEKVTDLLNNSYEKLQGVISDHSNEELFEKGKYKWTGNNALAAYLTSVTASHYEWARKLINRSLKKSFLKEIK